MKYIKRIITSFTTFVLLVIPCAAESGLYCRYSGDCSVASRSGFSSDWVIYTFIALMTIAVIRNLIVKTRVTIFMIVGVVGSLFCWFAPIYLMDGDSPYFALAVSLGGTILFFKMWEYFAKKFAPEIEGND